MTRRTPLHSVHEAQGARLIDFAGWDMPVWYDSATAEHHAVRSAAGLFDLSHMAELFVTGPGAAAALDWALLIEASAMPVGRARYTMICNAAGGIIDDLIVYRLDDESFMVVANASNGPAVMPELVDRASEFDAVVEDRTDGFALVAVQGPLAEQIVLHLTGPELGELKYYRVATIELLGATAYAARTGYTGEDGFELFVPAALARCTRRRAVERATAGRCRRWTGSSRPGRPRHVATRSWHAALWPRADTRDHPIRCRLRPTDQIETRRLRWQRGAARCC